jgi:hypothetical protein
MVLMVEESAEQVHTAFLEAKGLPFVLTHRGRPIYINPATIAYWADRGQPSVTSL